MAATSLDLLRDTTAAFLRRPASRGQSTFARLTRRNPCAERMRRGASRSNAKEILQEPGAYDPDRRDRGGFADGVFTHETCRQCERQELFNNSSWRIRTVHGRLTKGIFCSAYAAPCRHVCEAEVGCLAAAAFSIAPFLESGAL